MSAKIRVMLVDDSAVVRGMFDRALSADGAFEIVASAGNGEVAISMLRKIQVDVIILDVEMPVMGGIEALPHLLEIAPKSRIIMASTLTKQNAETSIKAMQLGAADFIAKPSSRDTIEVSEFYRSVITKVKALAPHVRTESRPEGVSAKPTTSSSALTASAPSKGYESIPTPTVPLRKSEQMRSMGALAIASSTGGPQALLSIFREFKGVALRVPIFITQHMPANFTAILADHISKACGMDCHEAVEDEEVKAGVIYVAPGDFHMTAHRVGASSIRLKLDQNPPENFCRPSADPMLRSLSKIYGDKLLVAVLTGLGADGARGASDVVNHGGAVVSQDEATSVVYGMPKAVADAKITSAVFPLSGLAPFLLRAIA